MPRTFLKNIRDWQGKNILSIVGPTGGGKTSLALDLVKERFASNLREPLLVSVDAVAAYQQLDIGSAKVSGSERGDFDWLGLDLFLPSEQVAAIPFAQKIEGPLREALTQGRPLILVGGSHFYERVLVDGKSAGGPSDEDFQKSLASLSLEDLAKRLYPKDKRWISKAHPNDRYRLSRFLDLSERQGLSFDDIFAAPSGFLSEFTVETLLVGLERPKEEHGEILKKRIRAMFAAGWETEVDAVLKTYGAAAPALQSVGYYEIVQSKTKSLPRIELEAQILIRHLQLAKKQRSWLRTLIAGD